MTAKDLLHKILDYNYLWSAYDTKNSRPAVARRKQIDVLQKALGLTKKHANPSLGIKYDTGNASLQQERTQYLSNLTDLEYLLKGEFLRDREEGANKELTERIVTKIKSLYPDLEQLIMNKPVSIGWLFNNLFNFRQEVYKLTYPGSGMLEGFSAGLQYSFYLQQQLKDVIKDNLTEIDDTLWLLLDPGKRTLNKDEINYPEADLDEIDLAWRINNY